MVSLAPKPVLFPLVWISELPAKLVVIHSGCDSEVEVKTWSKAMWKNEAGGSPAAGSTAG